MKKYLAKCDQFDINYDGSSIDSVMRKVAKALDETQGSYSRCGSSVTVYKFVFNGDVYVPSEFVGTFSLSQTHYDNRTKI